jgi:hypothetical protein
MVSRRANAKAASDAAQGTCASVRHVATLASTVSARRQGLAPKDEADSSSQDDEQRQG